MHFRGLVDSFPGTSVGVFGSVAQSTAAKNLTTISTYQVDGKSTVTYTAPISIMTHLTHVQFFQSATLEDGEHSLLITVVNASDARMYWLDYLVYMPGSSSPSSTSSPISTPLSSDNSGSSHSGVSGGIIAAAVLVSVSVVVMLAVVALWWRKRKTRPQERGQYEIEGQPCRHLLSRDSNPGFSRSPRTAVIIYRPESDYYERCHSVHVLYASSVVR